MQDTHKSSPKRFWLSGLHVMTMCLGQRVDHVGFIPVIHAEVAGGHGSFSFMSIGERDVYRAKRERCVSPITLGVIGMG